MTRHCSYRVAIALLVVFQAAAEPRANLAIPFNHNCAVEAVVFSPDSRLIVSGAQDGVIRVWDRATGLEVRQLKGHRGRVSALSFAPDGKTLASGSGDQTLCLWDFADGKLRRRCEGHEGWVRSVDFAPDGKTVATGSFDETCRLWDAATGKELRKLDGHHGPVTSVSFSADGTILGTNDSRCSLRLWRVATGKQYCEIAKRRPSSDNTGLVMCGAGGLVATASAYLGGTTVWNTNNGEARISFSNGGTTLALAASANGRLLAAGTAEGEIMVCEALSSSILLIFSGHEGEWYPKGFTRSPGIPAAIYTLAFSPDGAWLAAGAKDGRVRLWRLTDLMAAATKPEKLRTTDLEETWKDLASDESQTAYRALVRLTLAPELALPFLKKHLVPVAAIDEREVRRWIAELDSDDFDAREKASVELQRCAELARLVLLEALEGGKLSAEAADRVRRVVSRLRAADVPSERLRELRAVQALEWMATSEAARQLTALAKGQRGAPLTDEARNALRRMERQAK